MRVERADVATAAEAFGTELALPADATTVALELVSTNTIPVFKFKKTDGDWVVTNKTPVIEIVAGDTLTFTSDEAKTDDPDVSDEQVTVAIIDAIDPTPDKPEVQEAAVAKVLEVAAGDEPEVEPKTLAKWITDNGIKSADLATGEYVAASANLDTPQLINDATDAEMIDVVTDTTKGFTFKVELEFEDATTEIVKAVEKKVSAYIRATDALDDGFEHTVDPERVTVDLTTGTVTIKPDPTKSSEFFKIVIPRDSDK